MDKDKVPVLAHMLAGLIILAQGFDNFEKGDLKAAAIYLTVAILFMIIAGLNKYISRRFLKADAAFFLSETLIIFYIAGLYKAKGSLIFFYLLAVISAFYLVLCIKAVLVRDNKRHHSRKSKRRKHSSEGSHSHHGHQPS